MARTLNTTTASSENIPQYNSHPVFHRSFRFVTTAAIGQSFSPSEFCHMLSWNNGSNTIPTASQLWPAIACIRIKRLRIWSGPASSNAPTTVACLFVRDGLTTNFGFLPEFSDTSVSTAVPAHLDLNTLNYLGTDWLTKEDLTNVIQLVMPAGSILQLDVDFVLQMELSAASAYSTGLVCSFPTLGLGYLDMANSSGSRKIQPITSSDASWY